MMLGSVAASSTSELASVTVVPPADAGADSVMVHVAGSPLPPAITDGLHESELADCAWAPDVSSAVIPRPMPTTTPSRCETRLTMPPEHWAVGGAQGTGHGPVQTSARSQRTDCLGYLSRC